MKVYNATQQQLEQAASAVPCQLSNLEEHSVSVNVKYWTVVLRPTTSTPEKCRKTGDHDRRVHELSWYGHKMFYDALFDLVPQARVETAYWSDSIVYDGIESYKAQVR